MIELAPGEESIEYGDVQSLPRDEMVDFKLLSIAAQVAELERRLTPFDYARVPSLLQLVGAARQVATDLGYGEEASDGA
jgi:hypothetical protein